MRALLHFDATSPYALPTPDTAECLAALIRQLGSHSVGSDAA